MFQEAGTYSLAGTPLIHFNESREIRFSEALFDLAKLCDATTAVATCAGILGTPSAHSSGISANRSTCHSTLDRLSDLGLCSTNRRDCRVLCKADERYHRRVRGVNCSQNDVPSLPRRFPPIVCSPLLEHLVPLVPPLAVSSQPLLRPAPLFPVALVLVFELSPAFPSLASPSPAFPSLASPSLTSPSPAAVEPLCLVRWPQRLATAAHRRDLKHLSLSQLVQTAFVLPHNCAF